jgi:sortase A
MTSRSYSQLRRAPCRYSGSVRGEDLVLMAHNYKNHFGRISRLNLNDSVSFTDMDGITTHYKVAALDILESTAVETMTAGEFDLTLFTCTYGGKSRVTVYCNKE